MLMTYATFLQTWNPGFGEYVPLLAWINFGKEVFPLPPTKFQLLHIIWLRGEDLSPLVTILDLRMGQFKQIVTPITPETLVKSGSDWLTDFG